MICCTLTHAALEDHLCNDNVNLGLLVDSDLKNVKGSQFAKCVELCAIKHSCCAACCSPVRLLLRATHCLPGLHTDLAPEDACKQTHVPGEQVQPAATQQGRTQDTGLWGDSAASVAHARMKGRRYLLKFTCAINTPAPPCQYAYFFSLTM